MFKKLKREFLVFNMSLLTLVFVSVFSIAYILAAVSTEHQTNFELNNLMQTPPSRPGPDKPGMAGSIIVDVDRDGNIVSSYSWMDINLNTIAQAVSDARSSKKISDHIMIGDIDYAFLIRTSEKGMRIVYIDRTQQQKSLHNLMLIFILVGSLSLGILLIISYYFAGRAIKPIQEMFNKQKQFIGDASHELKTPLTVIKTNAALISANPDQSVASQSRWIGYISEQADRMSDLVNDMLSLARYDNLTEPAMNFTDFNLSEVLTGSLLSFEAILFENRIMLQTRIAEDIIFHGEKENIQRLIFILLDNAVKNTPAEGSISVELDRDRTRIHFAVCNTGSGISPEHLEKIFERFYRVDTSRSRDSGGYGLGLSIAKAVAEQHQGKIYAKSRVGIDTSFIVELPLNS